MLTAVLRAIARLYPYEVEAGDELQRSLAFLGWDLAAETVVRAGYGVAILLVLAAAPLTLLVELAHRPLVLVLGLGVGLGVCHAVHRGPVVAATLERTRALGAAPELVGRAVLRMRVDPTEEGAVSFAARSGDGPLAESLRDHVRASEGTPESGLDGFAVEWREWFPALSRASHLLGAAATAPPARRERALERALDAVLDGTRDRLRSFVAGASGPVTAIYAFGVLLPLALVAVVPGARAAGVPVTLLGVVLVYDLLLPLVLAVAAGWLLVKRPVAFPPPSVDRTHPDVPDRRWPAPVAGLVSGAGVAMLVSVAVAEWLGILAGVGVGIGVALAVAFRPVVQVRERVRAVEEGLPDAMYLLGRRVDGGRSVERSIALSADEVPGETGDLLADAARRGRQLGVGPELALLGDHGALADVPSRRARSTAELLALAASEGEPAGQAIVATAGHLEDLQSVERDARHELARVTGTLRNTAAVFAPLVAGATVALAEGMATFGAESEEVATFPTAGLGIAVGAYVLLLAVLLTGLSTAIEHGLDRSLLCYRAGIALASASAVFVASFVGAGALL